MAYYGIQWLPKVLAFNIYENERDKYMYMHYRLHYQAKVHTEYQRNQAAYKYKEHKILCNKIFKRTFHNLFSFWREKRSIQYLYNQLPRGLNVFNSLSFFPANMSDVEREWKLEFYQWKTNYMVQWQKQFDKFVKSYEDRLQSCSAPQAEA